MAQYSDQFNSLQLTCSICLELLRDPVTIPCGHSYCRTCIQGHWNEDMRGMHRCPLCRKTFTLRPVLVKNVTLADLVEEMKESGLGAPPADHCYAGAEDVACDVCIGRKLKAAKSCLSCLANYCEKHLQPHYQAAPLKKHQLVEPSSKLQDSVCSRHDEVKKVFCRTDQQCICFLCAMEEHRGHDTVAAAAERNEKQKQLEESRQQVQQRIQEGEEKMKELQQQTEAIIVSTDAAMKDCERNFDQLIHLIQERKKEVEQQLQDQQESELKQIGDLQEKLQQDIDKLKIKNHLMEQLVRTWDHQQFLHNYPSVCALSQPTCFPSIPSAPESHCKDLAAALRETSQKIQRVLRGEETSIPQAAPQVGASPGQAVGGVRAGLLKYSRDLTLDPETANEHLVLSEGNKKVTFTNREQPYSRNQSRFISCFQVLSIESLTGRCYWEVGLEGTLVSVAVAYQSISRERLRDSSFGENDKSWALYCGSAGFNFFHNRKSTKVSGPKCQRVGVFLDHSAGTLSFYSIAEKMTLLHQVHTTFTQPLYAGLYLNCTEGNTAEFCQLGQSKDALV